MTQSTSAYTELANGEGLPAPVTVAEATHSNLETKLAARLFHMIENLGVETNSGEEIFCVCARPGTN